MRGVGRSSKRTRWGKKGERREKLRMKKEEIERKQKRERGKEEWGQRK